MATTLTLAVDAMGGDHAPSAVVRGAMEFLAADNRDSSGVHLALVGEPEAIRTELAHLGASDHDRISIVSASQQVLMDDHPVEAIRRKPDSSISVCAKMVKSGEAQGTMSAGNTGACMVAAMMILGRLADTARPPIASLLPTEKGIALLVDAGSNVDCTASQLVQFAALGGLYAQRVMNIPHPKVGLLSNGEEESKGNRLVQETLPLIHAAACDFIHFIGPVEGNQVFEGRVDVVVSDGFSGNVLLKTAEGMATLTIHHLQAASAAAPDNAELRDALRSLRKRVDYAEYGGAPLLGINGVSVIAHGRSDSRAIHAALNVTARSARSGYVAEVARALEGLRA